MKHKLHSFLVTFLLTLNLFSVFQLVPIVKSKQTIFSDGFESGDFSAWSWTWTQGGGSVSVASAGPHHGTYHAKASCLGGTGPHIAQIAKTISPTNIVYTRCYVQYKQNLPENDRKYTPLAFVGSDVIAKVGVYNDAGTLRLILQYLKNGNPYGGFLSTAYNIALGTYYCIEAYVKIGSADGAVALYVNGNLVLSDSGFDNDDFGNVQTIIVGEHYYDGTNAYDVYVDCVVVADTYIGTEAGWLEGWQYRKSHVINPASGAGTNYQVRIKAHYGSGTDNGEDVYFNGKCRTDFGDVMFTASDGMTLLPYFAEVGSGDEQILKKISASAIAADGTIFAGGTDTIYKSADKGRTWTSLITVDAWYIRCVWIQPSTGYIFFSPESINPDVVGLWRSIDGGQNWSRVLPLTSDWRIWGIDEDGYGNIYAGVYGNSDAARIYKSSDNGETWTQVYYNSSARHIHCVEVDKNTNYIYATFGDTSYGIIRSTDGGSSWSQILTDLPICVAIEITPNARLFGTDIENGRIYRTTDDANATLVLNTNTVNFCFWIRRNPITGNLYASFVSFIGDPAIYKSQDDGQTWSLYKELPYLTDHDGSQFASNFMNGMLLYNLFVGLNLERGYFLYDPYESSYRATFWVKILDDLSTNPATIYVYYGNPYATTASSLTDTFIRIIDNAQPLKLSLPMDEVDDSTVYDKSGNNNDGTVGGALLVDGKQNKALSFDGEDDYVMVPYFNESRTELTISLWVLLQEVADGYLTLIKRAGEWRIYQEYNTRQLAFAYQDKNGVTHWLFWTHDLDLNVWHHIVVTFSLSQGIAHMYLNGTLINSSTDVVEIGANPEPIVVSSGYPPESFKGIIDEVRIFNKALSSAEISDLYHYYPFELSNINGQTIIRKQVRPEPSHGTWGSEEMQR